MLFQQRQRQCLLMAPQSYLIMLPRAKSVSSMVGVALGGQLGSAGATDAAFVLQGFYRL
jgi:hypothetical protein